MPSQHSIIVHDSSDSPHYQKGLPVAPSALSQFYTRRLFWMQFLCPSVVPLLALPVAQLNQPSQARIPPFIASVTAKRVAAGLCWCFAGSTSSTPSCSPLLFNAPSGLPRDALFNAVFWPASTLMGCVLSQPEEERSPRTRCRQQEEQEHTHVFYPSHPLRSSAEQEVFHRALSRSTEQGGYTDCAAQRLNTVVQLPSQLQTCHDRFLPPPNHPPHQSSVRPAQRQHLQATCNGAPSARPQPAPEQEHLPISTELSDLLLPGSGLLAHLPKPAQQRLEWRNQARPANSFWRISSCSLSPATTPEQCASAHSDELPGSIIIEAPDAPPLRLLFCIGSGAFGKVGGARLQGWWRGEGGVERTGGGQMGGTSPPPTNPSAHERAQARTCVHVWPPPSSRRGHTHARTLPCVFTALCCTGVSVPLLR